MNTASSDRNLLFGVLAVQMDFVSRDALVAAMNAWVLDKAKALGEILVAQQALTPKRLALLESLVEEHLNEHDNDPHKSLAAVDSSGLASAQLGDIADPDLKASLAGIVEHPDPSRSVMVATTLAYQPEGRERYTLSRLYAQGGIGQVWLARDGDIGRDVALKELIPGRADSPAVLARFLEEAKITGQLEHPSIVPVYELFHAATAGGDKPAQKAFYTMRFVKGRTLSNAIKEYHRKRVEGTAGPLDLRELLGGFVAVCNAVAYAHSRGVIHRDLKGANVVLGDFGEVMVLDWGLAKVSDGTPEKGESGAAGGEPTAKEAPSKRDAGSSVRRSGFGVGAARGSVTYRDLEPVSVQREASRDETMQGQVLGTPAYMPPEQAEGRLDLIDQRSDVYSLGAVLYEILTGQPPFEAPSAVDILLAVLERQPDRPRRRVPETPLALEAICLKALSKKREDRYASASDLAQEVENWLADEPVSAYREPLPARAARWARRHKTLVAAASVLMATAIVALSVSTILIGKEQRRTEQARQLAQRNFEDAEAQRQRAEESFRQARQAVDEYFTKVSESKLLNVPGLQPLRKELLEAAQKYYQDFIDNRGDDPALRGDLGKSWFRVGLITNDVGAKPDALAAYRKGRDMQEELLRMRPEEVQTQSDLAETCWNMGELERWSGQFSDSLRSYERSRELREQLAREHPDVPAYQNSLAKSYAGIGELYQFTDRNDDAVRAYEQARDLAEAVVREHGDDAQFQRDLADTCRRLGELQSELEQPAQSLSSLQRAIGLLAKLVLANPPYTEDQYHLGWSQIKSALSQQRLGDLPGAIESCSQARDILDKLVRENPSVTEYRNGLAASYSNLGYLQRASGLPAESLRSSQLACDEMERIVRDHPTISVYQLNLVSDYRTLGQAYSLVQQPAEAIRVYRQARDHLEALVRENPTVPDYEYELAKSYWWLGGIHAATAEPAEASRSFRQALDLLEKLIHDHPDRASFRNVLAWYLATCPDPQLRDGPRAVAAANKAVEVAPKFGNYVNTLGVAYYRAGDWRSAVATLEKSIELRAGGSSEDFFFLAMAHWQLNHKDQAHQWYVKAIEWMTKNQPDDEELDRFHAEAATLLGETEGKE